MLRIKAQWHQKLIETLLNTFKHHVLTSLPLMAQSSSLYSRLNPLHFNDTYTQNLSWSSGTFILQFVTSFYHLHNFIYQQPSKDTLSIISCQPSPKKDLSRINPSASRSTEDLSKLSTISRGSGRSWDRLKISWFSCVRRDLAASRDFVRRLPQYKDTAQRQKALSSEGSSIQMTIKTCIPCTSKTDATQSNMSLLQRLYAQSKWQQSIQASFLISGDWLQRTTTLVRSSKKCKYDAPHMS